MYSNTHSQPTLQRSSPRSHTAVTDRAVYKAELSSQIGKRLHAAALRTNDGRAQAEARLMLECSRLGNTWIAKDVEHLEGDINSPDGADVSFFDAYGHLWSCNSRLCPVCSEKIRKRQRRRMLDTVAAHKLTVGYDYRLLTLTQPVPRQANLPESIGRLQTAWSLFSKRTFFEHHIRGGFKGVEFVPKEHGYHAHIHSLIESRFIPIQNLIDEWENCVSHARAHSSDCNTRVQCNASMSLRLVRSRDGENDRWIGRREAVQEVLKYVTKPQNWLLL
jgi:hypothetical protein